MTEQEIKSLCKWLVKNSNHPLSDKEKEVIKQAIDDAKNIEELTAVAVAMLNPTKGR